MKFAVSVVTEFTYYNTGNFGRKIPALSVDHACELKDDMQRFLANVNSRSLYAIARPSVRLYIVCNVRAPYSGG